MELTGKTCILKSLGNVENVYIKCSPFDIGRSKTAQLIIPHLNISRSHCQITFTKNYTWIIEDFSSSGTFVNGALIGKGKSNEIKNNDIIRLGPVDCKFVWQFKIYEDIAQHEIMHDEIGTQAIVDICNQQDSLQRRIILNRQSCEKKKNEVGKLQEQWKNKLKELEKKYLSVKKEMEKKNICIMEKQVEEEKKKIENDLKNELLNLQKKLTENNEIEKQLNSEIEMLQNKLVSEKLEWEKRFLEEKKKLEEQIKEKDHKLMEANEKLKKSLHDDQLAEKLRQKEQEKNMLIDKLQEIEQVKVSLMDLVSCTQDKVDKTDQNLVKIKNTLTETRCEQGVLEKELTEAALLKVEANKMRATVLENIADLMESELQCGICSELFITAITLNCAHTFCKFCIDMWKRKKKNCPICRKKITRENRSVVMDNYIDKMVENLSEEFKVRRKTLVAERKESVDNGVPDKKSKLSPSPSPVDTNNQRVVSRPRSRSGRQNSRNSVNSR